MHIVEADASHLEKLATLFDAYRVWYRKESDLAAASKFLGDRIANRESVIYLAQPSGTMAFVGFTQLYPLFSSTRMGKLWLLNDLYVSPAYRGQGVSIKLIDKAKELARSTNAVGLMLETEKNNDIGNQLYPRANFELDHDMNHFFWKNDDWINTWIRDDTFN